MEFLSDAKETQGYRLISLAGITRMLVLIFSFFLAVLSYSPIVLSATTDHPAIDRFACDGQADDTLALAQAIRKSRGYTSEAIVLPKGTCVVNDLKISGSDIVIRGSGRDKTTLVPGPGAHNSVLLLDDASNVNIRDLTINTTDHAVGNVIINSNVQVATFENIGFVGNFNGDLVRDEGDTTSFINTFAYATSSDTWFLNFTRNASPSSPPMYGGNNHSVTGGVMYGGRPGSGGQGIRVTQYNGNGKRWRIEGLLISGWKYISDGRIAIKVGNSLYVQVLGCIIDQFSQAGVYVADGADATSIENNWFGSKQPIDKQVGVIVKESVGVQTDISGNQFNNLDYGVQILASPNSSATDVGISNNRTWFIKTQPFFIDSAQQVVISNNRDQSHSTAGTIGTAATRGNPTGVVVGNIMNSVRPSPYNPGGLKFGENLGPVGAYGLASPGQ